MEKLKKQIVDIIENSVHKKYIHGAVFSVSKGIDGKEWTFSAGNLTTGSRYYIASINKLFISSIVLKLIHEGSLRFNDSLYQFLSEDEIKGLHIYKGIDYSKKITILHLLSQTTGLPCYLEDKSSNGSCIIEELIKGNDVPCPTKNVIKRIKTMKPHFPPGKENKAKYIDTNHQLLNIVIEKTTGKPVNEILSKLFIDLKMENTNVAADINDTSYVLPYYKDEARDISQYITSTQNDIISTVNDQMKFIKAFFNGYFYPKEKLKTLEKWNSIFFPFKYGIGIQKFYMPRILSPFSAVPDMVGHCGSTGSVAFYIPEKDLYICGTTNQQARPSVAFQTIIKIVNTFK